MSERKTATGEFLDPRAFGRLLDGFDEVSGPGAIVAVTADHGESLGEEGFYFSHGFGTAPNLAHVPFLLRAPGLAEFLERLGRYVRIGGALVIFLGDQVDHVVYARDLGAAAEPDDEHPATTRASTRRYPRMTIAIREYLWPASMIGRRT